MGNEPLHIKISGYTGYRALIAIVFVIGQSAVTEPISLVGMSNGGYTSSNTEFIQTGSSLDDVMIKNGNGNWGSFAILLRQECKVGSYIHFNFTAITANDELYIAFVATPV